MLACSGGKKKDGDNISGSHIDGKKMKLDVEDCPFRKFRKNDKKAVFKSLRLLYSRRTKRLDSQSNFRRTSLTYTSFS